MRAAKPILFSEFVSEMHEVLREARNTNAVDGKGRNIELYFGDMMQRLEAAVDIVNARMAHDWRGAARRGAARRVD